MKLAQKFNTSKIQGIKPRNEIIGNPNHFQTENNFAPAHPHEFKQENSKKTKMHKL